MSRPLSERIALLNQTTLESLSEKNYIRIIEKFTLAGMKMLDADFGYSWWKIGGGDAYKLAYCSPSTPFEPRLPREKGTNFEAMKNNSPFFVKKVRKEVMAFMKSYVIIPISYNEVKYGSIVLCYTAPKHALSAEDTILSVSLGNTAAQAITIHDLIRKEQESRAVKERLEQEKIRTEFIADATHEIRTPLAIIRGNADLALACGGSASFQLGNAKKAFQEIVSEVEHLSRLISDLSILTAEGREVEKRIIEHPADIAALLKRTAERLAPLALEKKILIRLAKMEALAIQGDEMYLEKLFLNLMKNAITYGKQNGRIDISAKKQKGSMKIAIKDDGIGISKADASRIFERFYKAASGTAADHRRTGLGLAIAKRIAEMHGGGISVSSVLGKGSVFTVSLPYA